MYQKKRVQEASNDRRNDPVEWKTLSDEQRNIINEWNNNEKVIRRNTVIICVAVTIVVALLLFYKLMTSEYTGTVEFQYIFNQRTGERGTLLKSLLLYILFWGVLSTLYSSYMVLFAGVVYCVLHRKDKRLFDLHYSPSHGRECSRGVYFAAILTSVSVAVMLALNAFGILITPSF